jgi:hypothetical protein
MSDIITREQEEHQLNKLQKECSDLGRKLEKLDDFRETKTFRDMSFEDQNDLHEQASFMRGYRRVLDRRIGRFMSRLRRI